MFLRKCLYRRKIKKLKEKIYISDMQLERYTKEIIELRNKNNELQNENKKINSNLEILFLQYKHTGDNYLTLSLEFSKLITEYEHNRKELERLQKCNINDATMPINDSEIN